jgi:NAD+ synthase (glutamine-hydrolysing)
LYGDTAGGFAVIKDVPKTWVYKLANYRNGTGPSPVIPESIIQRAPSAELKPNQKDQDSLPPYDLLDGILELYVSKDRGVQEIMARGFDRGTVLDVARMVDQSEYKRRQTPPGVKISPRAFGKDRRMPLTNKFRFVR